MAAGLCLSSRSPVIAARPFTIPYLTALLPSELEMQQMEETDSSEQDEQTDTENLPLHISTVGAFRLLLLGPALQTYSACLQPVPTIALTQGGTCLQRGQV